METLKFNLSKVHGCFKPMHAVNNGPVYKRHANDQWRTNINEYTAAKIPYARNHDAAFDMNYGGEHSVDITAIFPNFDADPYSPQSYDFACTDEYIHITNLANTKTFYRLGQKIEHYVKKFGTIPPNDFKKWAIICEHIIRHYAEGWADGFDAGIEYWEIWNEPDLSLDDDNDKKTWGGTMAQFFDFYEITAKHLKSCFPHLKIGGPALAGFNMPWTKAFLKEMHMRGTPIDFFSWHIYCTEPKAMTDRAEIFHALLVENGYENAESILNEWNYVKNWTDKWIYSIEQITGIKGAAFIMASMSAAQQSSIDMLMYYDARPCVMNGLFDYYTLRPLKGYYPFLWFSEFYGELTEVRAENSIENIYSLCGVDENGKVKAVITYYSNDDGLPDKDLSLDFGKDGKYAIYALNDTQTNECIGESLSLKFSMEPNSCLFIKEL